MPLAINPDINHLVVSLSEVCKLAGYEYSSHSPDVPYKGHGIDTKFACEALAQLCIGLKLDGGSTIEVACAPG